MKKFLYAVALLSMSGIATADCQYIYVDNESHWVCDYNPPANPPPDCGYVYIDGKALWVCK